MKITYIIIIIIILLLCVVINYFYKEHFCQLNDEWKTKELINLEKESIQQQNRLNDMMKKMFKSSQIRYVTSLLKDMYQCPNDSEQQLYYLLSLPFCSKKIFLKLEII